MQPSRGAGENAESMQQALGRLRTGGVAPARPRGPGRPLRCRRRGGLREEALVAWGDPEATLRAVLASLGDGAELLTLITGDDAPLDGSAIELLLPDGVEVELEHGGQPSWWWLVSAESAAS